MTTEPGLRERKKQQTRRLIHETAARLFAERGFDAVTVAEIARAAEVSEVTVFNYFPTKEDLFFDRQAEVEAQLAAIVRARPSGSSAAAAVGAELLSALARDEPTLGLSAEAGTFWRLVAASPALQARGRQIGERSEAALAAVLAEEASTGPDDPLPRLLAGAIAGAHRAAIAEIRRRVIAGEPAESVRRSVAAAVEQAFRF